MILMEKYQDLINYYQHGRSSEHVAKWIVHKIKESSCIKIGISDDLAREERLSGSRSE